MDGKFEIQLIFHFKVLKEYYIKIFDTKKKIKEGKITFELSKNIFDAFQVSCPTEVYLLSDKDITIKSYTFNILKGSNYYHFYSFNNTCSFECVFYKEDKLNITVKGEKIKEYDEYSNFKRFSLVNIDTNEIEINGNKINLFHFYPRNSQSGNSFQLSFYDINKKFIVSKNITPFKEMNFMNFYEEKKVNLEEFSEKLSQLAEDEPNFDKNILG